MDRFEHHIVFERINNLNNIAAGWTTNPNEMIDEYEKIQEDVYRLCRNAESKCKKIIIKCGILVALPKRKDLYC